MTTYLIVGDNGEPLGVADIDQITTVGTELAFAMAAHCDDAAQLDRIVADYLARVGTASFGYVAACALRIMAEQILSPSLDVVATAGHDLRPGIRAIAEGRQP